MTDSTLPPQRHGWLIANLVLQLAFGLLAMTICIPSMQDWPATFGASQASVQLTFSGFIVAYGGLQLLYGPLSDRRGRKPVLVAGLALACTGSLLGAMVDDLAWLTFARVLQGAGSGAGMVVGRALVQDLFGGHERTRMMAIVGMTMGVCPPLGTLLGGYLHVHAGWQANFWLMAVVAAVLLVAAWRGLPSQPPATATAGGWRTLLAGYRRLLGEPAFLLYVTLLACTTATFYSFLGGAPIVLKTYGVTPDRVGWYILCIPMSYIAGNLLTTRLIQRRGDRTIMRAGQVLTLVGLLLVVALGVAGAKTPLALALPLVLLGIGHGLLAPPTLSGTVGLIPALAGSAAAVGGLMQQFAGAFGGFVVGIVPHDDQLNLGLIMLAWAIAGLLAQLLLFRVVLPRAKTAAA